MGIDKHGKLRLTMSANLLGISIKCFSAHIKASTSWKHRSKLFILICFLASTLSFSQEAYDEMRSNLNEGYYALAARVSGPLLIRSYPDDPEAHYLYSYALYITGSFNLSREALNRALELNPSLNPEYNHLNGLLHAAEGDTETAKQLLQNAYIRNQAYETAMDWGRVAWQDGDYDSALTAFQEATTTPQGKIELWPYVNQGRILKAQGNYEEAIAAFTQAINIFEANDPGSPLLPSPGFVEAYYRIGEIHELLGNIRLARSYYEGARNSDPNYAPAVAALDRLARGN